VLIVWSWPPGGRWRDDAGGTLLLMPAGLLVVLVLAAIAVDLGAVHLGRRDLVHAAGAAANDAVTDGLDEVRLRRGEGYHLDRRRVEEAVRRSLDAQGALDDLTEPAVVVVEGTTVTVTLTGLVEPVFARALPGAGHGTRVRAEASATARSR
jgi:hypothetical protein